MANRIRQDPLHVAGEAAQDASRARRRAGSRRPISHGEVPYLVELGAGLRRLRTEAGLTQARLAYGAQMHKNSLQNIEHACRRTRRSTLERIAAVLVRELPPRGTIGELVEYLVGLAGPALAPESEHRDLVERRRRRRVRKRDEAFEAQCEIEIQAMVLADGLAGRWAPELAKRMVKEERAAIRRYASATYVRESARLDARKAHLDHLGDQLGERQAELRRRERELNRREVELRHAVSAAGPVQRAEQIVGAGMPRPPAPKVSPAGRPTSSSGPVVRCALLGCDNFTAPGEALCGAHRP